MKIGYARVSTQDQNLEPQVEALEAAGCELIFKEKVSGAKIKRKELDRMISHLRPGDEVVVYKLDRLGRSTVHLIDTVEKWRKNNITFRSLSDNLVFDDTPVGNMVFTVLSAFAQFERDLIKERTMKGLAHAAKMGRRGGRKPGLSKKAKEKAAAAETLYKRRELSTKEIAKQLGISTATLYKYLKHQGVELNSSINSLTPTLN